MIEREFAESKRRAREATSKCWCSKKSRQFGIVLIADDRHQWSVLHSYLCSPKYVDKSSEHTGKIGRVQVSDGYNGCKHCGNNSLFQCNDCKEYSCYRSGGISPLKVVKCGNCGMRGAIAGFATSMNISGD